MKKLILLAALLTLTLSCSSSSKRDRSKRTPSHDQYWNDMSNEATNAHARITDVLKENNPALYNQLLLDSKDPILPMFWGKSLNFDSGAKKVIVDEKIIEDLQRMFNIKNDNKIVHAGIMHTYGYLFSTIDTPYGYKRKRWIEPTLNTAFGLTGNSLSPDTIDGGLLSNLTYFAGMFVLSDKTQLQALKNVSNEIIAFDYTKQPFERVEEKTKNFTLITTLIKFPVKPEGDDNDYLLIYSIDDKRVQKEFLITAFPINTDSYKKIVAPETLGENQKITLRYNAYLEGAGVTSLIGERKLIKK